MNSGIFLFAILLVGVVAVSAFPKIGETGVGDERHHGGEGLTGIGGWRPHLPHRPFVPPFFWRPPFHRPTKRTTTTTTVRPTDSTDTVTTGQPGVSTQEPVTATSPPEVTTVDTVQTTSEPGAATTTS